MKILVSRIVSLKIVSQIGDWAPVVMEATPLHSYRQSNTRLNSCLNDKSDENFADILHEIMPAMNITGII